MRILKRYIKIADSISEWTGKGVIWLTSLLVIIVCFDVFTRYVLRESSVAIQELEWHLFALIFLLGAAYTLKYDKHVRVDVIYARLSEKAKAWINFFGSILFLIPFSLLGIFSSKLFVAASWRIMETSPDPGGLPGRYLLKSVIPIAFLLLLIQAVSLAFRSLLTIRNAGDIE